MHQPGASLGIVPSLRSLLRQEVWLSWTGSCGCTQSALDTSLCFSGLRGLLISEPFTQPGALPGLPHSCTHPPTHPGAHFTETENSPGELSLSRIRKAPKWFRFIRVSSASCREILPEYHLCREGTVSALGSAGPLSLAPLSHFPHGEIEKQGSKSRLHSRGKKTSETTCLCHFLPGQTNPHPRQTKAKFQDSTSPYTPA